jgi:hypothetical protein
MAAIARAKAAAFKQSYYVRGGRTACLPSFSTVSVGFDAADPTTVFQGL